MSDDIEIFAPSEPVRPASQTPHFDKLSPVQQRAVAAYMVTLSYTAAARTITGGSGSNSNIHRMLTAEDCQLAISELLATQYHVTRGRVWNEIVSIATSNVVDFYERCPLTGVLHIADITEMPRHVTAAIKKVKQKTRMIGDQITENEIEFELHDKGQTLKQLAKIHGLESESPFVQVNANNDGSVTIKVDPTDMEY